MVPFIMAMLFIVIGTMMFSTIAVGTGRIYFHRQVIEDIVFFQWLVGCFQDR
jgi:hypothetical protein